MGKKIITTDIPSLAVSWENYSGESVEKFIKRELGNACGYIYRSPQKEGDYYYLYGFRNQDEWDEWLSGEDITPLFKVQLPNLENDTFTSYLYTNSNTNKLVNLGAGVSVNLRFTSTQSNPTTGITSDTNNEGTLIIMRSANGSAFVEVARRTIQSLPYQNTEAYTSIDITPYLLDGNNKIRFRVEDNVNGTISNNITFNNIINTTLRVQSATDLTQPLRSMTLQYYIEGQVAKTLNLRITSDGVAETFSLPIGEATYIEVPYTAIIDHAFTTGVKTVEAWLSVDDTVLESLHITSQFYYISDASNEGVIVLNNVARNITNYTNTKFFDFTLYNKNSDVEITVGDGSNTYLTYTYTNCLVGTVYSFNNTLEIESILDTLNLTVQVRTIDQTETYSITVDNTEKMTPTEGADFILNPKVRSNSEANPNTIINAATGLSETSTFSNFSFINDGWVEDEDGIRVLRIPAGKSLEIEYDPLDTLTNGTTIELDYKVKNVFNDDSVIAKFCTYNQGGNPVGFEMKSTEAVFMTVDNQTKRDQDVMFQEDVRTHMAINIVPNLSGSGLNYVRIFINGVMNREMTYANGDTFELETLSMIFGSQNADLDIYSIRVYKKGLSASDVRQDYMSSLPTIEEKIAFKTVNDILSANGTISFDKASVKYNTLVWTGSHPEYSTGKVDYIGDLAINILDDPAHSGTINGMKISGQGSSSRGYWKWNHTFKFQENSRWTDGNGTVHSDGYRLTEDDPAGKELVSKLNWASSMQSHKIGSTALYNDLWKDVIGGNTITKTQGSENARVAVHEKPFLYFFKASEQSNPVFGGLVTFGSAKKDKTTWLGNDTAVWENNYLMLEGSDNGMPLLCRQVPWIEDEVSYDSEEKFYVYANQGNWDYVLGNKNRLNYFIAASNFVYLHSPALRPYTGVDMDPAVQYWDKTTGRVIRYDHITQDWVDAGITKDENSDTGYSTLNIVEQTGISITGSYEVDNANFIAWRVADFKSKIGIYYNVNDVLFSMAFLKMIAGSDNRAKNTYEYLDPGTMKICLGQDDMDTIMLTDNVGRKTKPYYVEEHDMNGVNPFFNGEDNNFFNLMDLAYDTELRAMMKSIFDTMRSSKYGGSVQECMDRYFFSIQKYFPAVAYNETARLLYEEASVAQAAGDYRNGTPAISQSLGNQLEAELQWWKRREKYLESWAGAVPFYVRSEHSLGFRSLLTTQSSRPEYSFALTPWQYLYPKTGVGQSMGADNTRVANGTVYNTAKITTDGNTDMFIYGADYYKSFGEFGDKSVGETFELAGKHLEEFSADSRQVQSYQFRPIAFSVNCPNLKRLCLYGCSTLTGNLNLAGCGKLTSLDLRNTNITSVSLPETDTLTTMYLPSGIASLIINNCPNLSLQSSTVQQLSNIETNNSTIALQMITGGTNLVNAKFNNINITTTSANEATVRTWLLNDITKNITGTVYLAKELTDEEIAALETKFGNGVFNVGSSFYITYIQTEISEPVISPTTLTLGPGETATITATYTGNAIKGWDWTSSSPTVSLTKTRKSLVITAPATVSRPEDITITYSVTKANNTTVTKTCSLSLISTNFLINGLAMDTNQPLVCGQGSPSVSGSFTITDTEGLNNWVIQSFTGTGITSTISGGTVNYSIANPTIGSWGHGELTIVQAGEYTYTFQIGYTISAPTVNVEGNTDLVRNMKSGITAEFTLSTTPAVAISSVSATFSTDINATQSSSGGTLTLNIPAGSAEGTINTDMTIVGLDANGGSYSKTIALTLQTISLEPRIIVDYEWSTGNVNKPLYLHKHDSNVITGMTIVQSTLADNNPTVTEINGYDTITVSGEGFLRIKYDLGSNWTTNLFKNCMGVRKVQIYDTTIGNISGILAVDSPVDQAQATTPVVERFKIQNCKTLSRFSPDANNQGATLDNAFNGRNIIKIDLRGIFDREDGGDGTFKSLTNAFQVGNTTEPCVLYIAKVGDSKGRNLFVDNIFKEDNNLVHAVLYSGVVAQPQITRWKVISGGWKHDATATIEDKKSYGGGLVFLADSAITISKAAMSSALGLEVSVNGSSWTSVGSSARSWNLEKGDYLRFLVTNSNTTGSSSSDYLKFTGNSAGGYRELGFYDALSRDNVIGDSYFLYYLHYEDTGITMLGDFNDQLLEAASNYNLRIGYNCTNLKRLCEYIPDSSHYLLGNKISSVHNVVEMEFKNQIVGDQIPEDCRYDVKYIIAPSSRDTSYQSFSNVISIPNDYYMTSCWGSTSESNAYQTSGKFKDCSKLNQLIRIHVSNPSFRSCFNFSNLFMNCTSLAISPVVDYGTSWDDANKADGWNAQYFAMFYGCTSLTEIDDSIIDIKTTDTYLRCISFSNMFGGCTSLRKTPKIRISGFYGASLDTRKLDLIFHYMFYNCSSLNDLTNLNNYLNITNFPYGSKKTNNTARSSWKRFQCMFYGCTSLTSLPVFVSDGTLNNTTARYYGGSTQEEFMEMFKNCTGLTGNITIQASIDQDFSHIGGNYFQYMFHNCSGITGVTVNCNAGNYLGWDNAFAGCSGLTSATLNLTGELSGNELNYMFYGDGNLSYLKAMFTGSNFGVGYTTSWMAGVANTGTYVMNAAASYDAETEKNDSRVHAGWTVQTALN